MTFRIVQWTTGNVGKRSVRAVTLNPQLLLVECYAWSEDKIGRVVGEPCGIEPVSVAATNDVEALRALKPDCVVYNPMFAEIDEMVGILSAGINIVCTSEFITGHFVGEGRDRIAAACEQGGSTIFGSGINPGFIQLFTIVSAGLSERVDKGSIGSHRHHHLQLTHHRKTYGLRLSHRPAGSEEDNGEGLAYSSGSRARTSPRAGALMAYKVDPHVLHKVARHVVGLPIEGGELVTRAIRLLADEYPDLIDPTPGRWVGSKAGGILGKVRFLYFSPREYIVIFGSPTGTQGFSGRYKHVEIHKFLIAGQIDSYDVESDETMSTTLLPGEHTCLESGRARGLTIHPGSWHIEYGRGAVVATLPFAMVDTLLVSLELESVRRSAVEFTKLVGRRFRR